ncbi:hypothetical protein K488DRAFT_68027 [Vararia minispora EC-137]|uniref:Uncharacterized protein n=1 Tax=Vararia minispora EC-137 TaxID=1314806 RepID=A0ACB8QVN7_9AGAM|nr:hypothetical protein K488DRAFT_68027 [Vararia minispora EC-137]
MALMTACVICTGSDQARFKLVKDAIELRKHGFARGTGAEETAVLAFGGGTASAAHVTRKRRSYDVTGGSASSLYGLKVPLTANILDHKNPQRETPGTNALQRESVPKTELNTLEMAQQESRSALNFQVYFVGNGDPRQCLVISGDTQITRLTFDTPVNPLRTITTIYQEGSPLAFFEWFFGTAPGVATIRDRRLHMADLVVMNGYPQSCRAFQSTDPDGSPNMFVWRNVASGGYDLLSPSGTIIGQYRAAAQTSPMGNVFAVLHYTFEHEPLFIDAILALAINRWIDRMGPSMPY